jgi:predicted porin
MVLYWDDGAMSDAYITTNDVSQSRFGFKGSAKIDSDWSAGYVLEIGIKTSASGSVSQFADVTGAITDFAPGDELGSSGGALRHAYWYIDSKSLGRLTVGQTDTPVSSTFTITLANVVGVEADPSNMGAGLRLRNGAGVLSDVFWANLMHPTQGSFGRNSEVMYTTPEFGGFQAKAAWGEADFWAVSLAYAGEFSGFRLAAKVAYGQMSDGGFALGAADTKDETAKCVAVVGDDANHTEVDCNNWVAGASIMHVATGLFLSGGYVDFTDNNRVAALDDNDTAWYVQGGIEQRYFAVGRTTLYGEYGEQENGNTGFGGTTLSYWGLGLTQAIDAAAMDMYLFYRQLSCEHPTCVAADVEDLTLVGAGAIIRF